MNVVNLTPKIYMSSPRKAWQAHHRAMRIHNRIGQPVALQHLSTRARIVLAFAFAVVVVPWWMGVVDILRAVFGH